MSHRILFVDDDLNVLDGLRRTLFAQRRVWEVRFAAGGADALRLLEDAPCDVIVSDMRMPGMDGAELLGVVRDRYPHMVRIVLSGQSEKESILRSVGVAHQYLAKPCDSEALKAVLFRACALGDLLAQEGLRRAVARVDSLPSVPDHYRRLVAELRSEDSSIQAVASIIASDPGMTAKILQMVNSSFFGLPRHLSNPTEAVAYLGLSTIKALALSQKVFTEYNGPVFEDFSPEGLMAHSLDVAQMARALAHSDGVAADLAEEAFLVGMLHDVGKLVLAANAPETYGQVLRHARAEGCRVWQSERELFGTSHAEVGAFLFGLWGLEEGILRGVAGHHDLAGVLALEEGTGSQLALWTHVADAAAHGRHGDSLVEESSLPAGALRERLAENLTRWRESLEQLNAKGRAA